MRALPVSKTLHGFKAGDTAEMQDGRIVEVKYVGLEPYTRVFGMEIEHQDGTRRFLVWNSFRDAAAMARMVKL